jgi:hypothetical protein
MANNPGTFENTSSIKLELDKGLKQGETTSKQNI